MKESENKIIRQIRSFVRREGRMTDGQTRALETLWPQFGCTVSDGLFQQEAHFNRTAHLVFEIGFGMGYSLLQMAQAEAQHDFIGVEVHRPGVGRLLQDLEQAQIKNVKVYAEDAVDVLKQCIADNSLSIVQIYFPDPWHKKRHHKRRLIQPEFLELISQKMKTGGILHLATDWENYAQHMLDVLSTTAHFKNTAGAQQYSPKPERRPNTKFEKRGQQLGHGVWDLVFERVE
jgi:tRNA (guanine-N7-)-methyltransferase